MAANVNLLNTASQVCQTLSETYSRLTGSYSGPLTASACAASGFGIQDANKNTGIFVTNASIQLCKPVVDFKANQDVCFLGCSTRSFFLSGNGSVFGFDCRGTMSAGSGIDSSYMGIQAYATNPSVLLRETDSSSTQAIRFHNCSNVADFTMCQSGNNGGLWHVSCDTIRFLSRGCSTRAMSISGNSVGFNTDPLVGVSVFSSGTFCNSGAFCQTGNQFITGTVCIGHAGTGLDVNTQSYFKCNILSAGRICVSGQNISTDQCILGGTGCFNYLCVTSGIYLDRANLSSILVTGGGGCCAEFCVVSKFRCDSCFCQIYATGVTAGGTISGAILCSASGIASSGQIKVFGTSFSHFISGQSLTVNFPSSGNLFNLFGSQCVYGRFRSCGDICTSDGTFCSLRSDINAVNYFGGYLCVGCNIVTPAQLCGYNVTTSTANVNSILGCCGCFGRLCQTDSTLTGCFMSNVNIGLSCTGIVNALNTAKAWGIFGICSGMVLAGATGMNFSGITLPFSSCASFKDVGYGIKFKTPIKSPAMNMFLMPVQFAGTGTMSNATPILALDTPRTAFQINLGNLSAITSTYTCIDFACSYYETVFGVATVNTSASTSCIFNSGVGATNNLSFTGIFFVYGS